MPIVDHLFVQDFGAFVSKHQGRLRVTVKGAKRLEAPLMHLQTVRLAAHGVSISADAIAACAAEGIPVYVVDRWGRPVATLYASALIGTVKTRRAQLLAYETERGLTVARALALGKLRHQAGLLRYLAKYRKKSDPPLYARLTEAAIDVLAHEQDVLAIKAARVDEAREALLSAEARGARVYWAALKELIPEELEWPGRRRRGAQDVFNMALNYGYGILYGEIERAAVLAGLDPYAGFLHTDRPGKPSLVLDLIEPFRPLVVDRTILAMITKGTKFEREKDGAFTIGTRETIVAKVQERLDAPARYGEQRLSLRAIIQHQARTLATFLRDETVAELNVYQMVW
ncbi:MAG: CRISPR-associated endonuclease Cas1 [Caldilineae bacterium]|nr:MAG: CRISPR-associated endonuclease Cas1 [Caldilineae bacterium]